MCFLDIRSRGWDGLTVQVGDFGALGSPRYLFVREVVEVPALCQPAITSQTNLQFITGKQHSVGSERQL
jgi:hypothetical protein